MYDSNEVHMAFRGPLEDTWQTNKQARGQITKHEVASEYTAWTPRVIYVAYNLIPMTIEWLRNFTCGIIWMDLDGHVYK